MTLASSLYTGTVAHRRHVPVDHRFRYRVFMLLLDLDEVDDVLPRSLLWSARRPAPVRFHRDDHLGHRCVPLTSAVRDLVASRTGRRPAGPVRLLTHPRVLGAVFNPISLYYCHDTADGPVTAVVAEVTNTPWGERHCYVLDLADRSPGGGAARGTFAKAMHVSPFLPMDLEYVWELSEPGERLTARFDCRREGERVLTATLALRREDLTAATLRRALLRHAPTPLVVLGGIHWQALRLWRKGVPYHAHPGHAIDGRPAADLGRAA